MRAAPLTEAARPPEEVARWCESFERRCRAAGLRVTAQRLAVYRALAEDGSHPTADGLYASLHDRMPGLSRATVYRILDSLERRQLVRRIGGSLGGGRFDANVSTHQHLVCRVCGAMVDVVLPGWSGAAVPAGGVPGFEIERLDVRLVGRCSRCRGSAGEADTRSGSRPRAPRRRR